MKLWLKISLICIAVMLLVVGACSTLLIINSRDKILSITIENTRNELSNLKESFSGMVSYYSKPDLDPFTKRSLINYCFHKFANDTAVLKSESETLFNNLSFDPEELLPQSLLREENYYMGTVSGRNILIAGYQISLLSERYTIYTVRDISEVQQNITKMILQFAFIIAVSIIIGIILVVFLVRLSIKPLKNLGVTARRIAHGKYAERARINTKDEVGDLAQDFNAMAEAVETHFEELQELTQRQQLFIGGLTHEFKTPLTSVIGHSETLLYTKMPEEVVANSLLHINEQCKWLERLTQKLLKLITLEEEIELKEESVDELLEAVKAGVAETLQKRKVGLVVENDIDTLPMDFDLMLSLLINLADNASKASAEGQSVHIKAHGRTIKVSDSGVGIPEEELSRIMEPFYMVDKSRSKKMGGSGLGLALVKKIADAHGALIAFKSISGRGTTVSITFPGRK